MGAAIAPQLMGIVIDKISVSEFASRWSDTLHQSPEQIGLRVGMLITAAFPIIGAMLVIFAARYFKAHRLATQNETGEREKSVSH